MARLLEVRTAQTQELSAAELAQLRELLVASFGPDYRETSWQHCLGGTHFLLHYRGELVSHVAVIPRHIAVDRLPLAGVFIESVATRPEFWGKRFGSALLAATSAHIVDAYDIGVMSTDRVGFYRRAGWEVWTGGSFFEDSNGALVSDRPYSAIMVILPPGSDIDTSKNISTDWREGDIW